MDIANLEVTEAEEAELKASDLEPEKVEPIKEEPVKVEPLKDDLKVDGKTEIKEALTKEQEIIRNLNAALKETREELKGFRSKLSTVDELKKALLARQVEEEKRNFVPPPDPNQDPFGYQQHMLRQIEAQQVKFAEQLSQTKLDTQTQSFIAHVQTQENSFRQQHPDYDNAIKFVSDIRVQELADFGVTDPDAIARELQQSAFGISQAALNQGKNPAEVLYNIARRYGYKAPETGKEEPAKERLEVIEEAQKKAGKTLSGGGDAAANATVEALLSAKGSEFDKLWKEMFEK